jgi:Protein of unknown function (DUF2934)
MARIVTKQQRAPLPESQKVELRQPTLTEIRIRLRANQIFLNRGTNPGDEVSDWLQAERELG